MLDAHIQEMDRILSKRINKANLLDVGSFDVNGTFRPLVEERGWKYIGVDIVPGKNVDIVSDSPYNYPFDNDSFEVVVSGSVMEHVEAIWLWIPELVRLLKPGGLLAIITHTSYPYHPHPVDCWRIMPDGMRYLFDQAGILVLYEIKQFSDNDISGSAIKGSTW